RDWSSDVCASDLVPRPGRGERPGVATGLRAVPREGGGSHGNDPCDPPPFVTRVPIGSPHDPTTCLRCSRPPALRRACGSVLLFCLRRCRGDDPPPPTPPPGLAEDTAAADRGRARRRRHGALSRLEGR